MARQIQLKSKGLQHSNTFRILIAKGNVRPAINDQEPGHQAMCTVNSNTVLIVLRQKCSANALDSQQKIDHDNNCYDALSNA